MRSRCRRRRRVALFGLGLSVLLIGVLAALIDVPGFATAIAGVVGIGVGIDYALLILTRFRSALAAGKETRTAVTEAIATAGRSVLIAGTTVVISFLGLFLLGVSFLYGVALSVSLAVLIVMVAAVTLLPALLGFVGHRVNGLRVPWLGRVAATGTLAGRWSRLVQRRAWPAMIAGAVALVTPPTSLAPKRTTDWPPSRIGFAPSPSPSSANRASTRTETPPSSQWSQRARPKPPRPPTSYTACATTCCPSSKSGGSSRTSAD